MGLGQSKAIVGRPSASRTRRSNAVCTAPGASVRRHSSGEGSDLGRRVALVTRPAPSDVSSAIAAVDQLSIHPPRAGR